MNISNQAIDSVILYLIEQIRRQETLIGDLQDVLGNQSSTAYKSKPHSEVSKLRIFMDIFNAQSGEDKNDVEVKNFVYELVKTGKFTEKEAYEYIKKALQSGQIYERKTGFYAKP